MLAYAGNRPLAGKRPSSPPAMLLIVSAHVALIALVMSAKMEMQHRNPFDGPMIFVPPSPPPPPLGATVKKSVAQADDSRTTRVRTDTDLPPLGGDTVEGDQVPAGGDVVTGGGGVTNFAPLATPVRHEARLLTSPSDLKPPYPELKILSGEEATLKLRLTISDSGRVTAVDPIGAADRVFLDAARRYLIAHWRYQPATEDGRSIASSVVISLRFQLDG